jgi:hypothetical protein
MSVGPGTYNSQLSFEKLKQRPCMTKIFPSNFLKEDCYEVVNNMKVL